jgi:hypothetical protein
MIKIWCLYMRRQSRSEGALGGAPRDGLVVSSKPNRYALLVADARRCEPRPVAGRSLRNTPPFGFRGELKTAVCIIVRKLAGADRKRK